MKSGRSRRRPRPRPEPELFAQPFGWFIDRFDPSDKQVAKILFIELVRSLRPALDGLTTLPLPGLFVHCVHHFEKMLYDVAQLARVYLHAWQVTAEPFFRRITEETLDYVMREMTDPSGGFYSTQDADSEGEEAKFFVWTPEEIREVLGEEADAFMATYGVTHQKATSKARISSNLWATRLSVLS